MSATQPAAGGQGPAQVPAQVPPTGLGAAVARLSRHTLVYAIAGQMPKLIAFALVPFYTSHLDRTDYGINELLGQIIAVLGYLAGINMTSAMARHYFDSAEPRHRRRAVSTTLWSVALGAGLLAGGLALFSGPLGRFVDPQRAGTDELVRMTLGILVLQLLREVWWRWLQTEERSTAFAVLATLKTLVEVALQVWFIAGKGWGLFGLVFAVLVSEGIAVVLLFALFARRIGFGFDRPLFAQLFAYTLPLVPNGILQFCLHSADRFLVSQLSDNAQVGAYGFAYKFGQIPNLLLLTPFLMVWYPFVFSLGDEGRQRELVGRLATWFLALMTLAALGVGILSHEIAWYMAGDPAYVPAWTAIPLVVVGYWFWGAFQLAQTGFYVKKRTGRLPLLTGIAAAFNLAANWLLIPRYGYMAAAWVTAATFALLLVITARAVRPLFPVQFAWGRILGPAALALALGALGTWAPGAWLGWEPGPATIALKLGVVAVWAAAFWQLCLHADERATVVALLPGARARRGRRGQ